MLENEVEFVICAPPYDQLNGGAIVLHKLCHILNKNGFRASLFPLYGYVIYSGINGTDSIVDWLRLIYKKYVRKFSTNPSFKTPLVTNFKKIKNAIVIYPEIVIGNPLNQSNIVRWFLCEPGMHNGMISISKTDLLVDFRSFLHGYEFGNVSIWDGRLFITQMPLEHYNLDGALPQNERYGSAYCIRKGKVLKTPELEGDAILIDGLAHPEVASILKRVKRFYSYDLYTAYSAFAALCGAESIVVPQPGLCSKQWFEDETNRYGVAYGTNDIEFAKSTRHKLLETIIERENESVANAMRFANFAISHFFGNKSDLMD